MNTKFKKILGNWRNITLIILLILAIITIQPNFDAEGVAIRNVLDNSSAQEAGIKSPIPSIAPMSREVITSLNSKRVTDMESYNDALQTVIPNSTTTIITDQNVYRLKVRPKYNITILNETEEKTITETIRVNETINDTLTEIEKEINKTIEVNKVKKEIIGIQDLGLKVYEAPTTNIRLGLDLQGGTRVLLEPDTKLNDNDMQLLLTSMQQRLNIYGLSDVVVRQAGDLSDNTYILVEIAGANEQEVKDLLAKQGKFEAKIANTTVFRGGERDITYVCRSADCSGIDPTQGCGQIDSDTWTCRFRFSISLSPDAAKAQAQATSQLDIISDEQGKYLEKPLELYLDDKLVDTLNIGADLKGSETTDIQISGSGSGPTQQTAMQNSLENMKRLQTYLSTGSLPVKINIAKSDTISPALGEEFIKNAIFIGILAILSVATTIFIRYRKLKISLPIIIYSTSEIIMLLGVAALIGWNLDLAAIAGIIIVVGTSVDHMIVITDEILRGETGIVRTVKQKIKNALFIIMGAFFTTAVAMLPLIFAGAGLLKGFALTTLIGIVLGVFIARPAFAVTIQTLIKK